MTIVVLVLFQGTKYRVQMVFHHVVTQALFLERLQIWHMLYVAFMEHSILERAENNLFVRYSLKQVRTARAMLLPTKLNKICTWLSYTDKYIKQEYTPFK